MQTEEKRENIEEKKEERMEMPVSGALEQGPGKAPVSGAEISVHDTENGHSSEDVYILAIESSCDETAASVVKNGRTVLSNIISSQIDLHTLFGGVVPEIASRKHIEKINQVIEEALTEAHMSLEEMTAIAVTYGPGLVGALLVGVAEAKALAYAAKKPLVGVHHIEGHVSANFIENPDLEPPFMCLIVSGGHTHLVIVKDYGEFEILGRTRDDAAGEAFDKVARAVGLGYPGGPKVDKAAKEGNPHAIEFPRAKVGDNPYDFSFSGLKSAVLNYINHAKMMCEEINVPDLAASFQNAVVEVLVSRTIEAAKQHGYKRVAIAGGVASNSALRAGMEKACKEAGLLSFMMGGTLFAPDMDFWNQNINIQRYGIALSFISDIRHMKLEEPAGYSSKDSEEMISKFVETEDEKEQNCPNVLAIMNESFSDLSVIFPELDNEVYMSNFNSLSGNVVKGYMQVYPIGGGTANTEYEFLTGNSMAFLQGSIPYQQYITRNGTYSIAQILKTRGYHTTAIHPYDKRGYNRAQVYPKIGFETFLDVSDFENAELIRDRYISDRDSYKKVIEEFEKIRQSGQPAFIFNVTMQNHSGYDAGCFTENAVRIPGHEGEFPNAEEYLTLIRESDAAIPMLIDYFSKIEDPTVIVFFGDHQPMVEESFYETLAGKPLTEWILAEAQSRYIVPFFIWANYEIDAEENVFTSANFLSELMFEKAGIKLLPYQEFLKEVREEIPAMDGGAWRDKDGTWEVLDTSQPILEEYWRLQYRNMFDKKVHY